MKVALVGSGGMARTHASGYGIVPGAELVAVMDYKLDRALDFASTWGVKAYDDFARMLAEQEIDVLDVCTPTYVHSEYAIKGLEAGKHVICEKPMARTIEQADAMIRAADASGKQLFVAQVLRFFPEFRKGYDLLKSGAVGEPGMIRTWRCCQFPRGTDDWFADDALSGGAPLDLLIHDIDWVNWAFGPVERVFARRFNTREPYHADIILVTLRFTSGAIAHLEGSFAHVTGFDCGFEVSGTGGVLEYKLSEMQPLLTKVQATGGTGPGVIVPASPTKASPYGLELKHFFACIEGKEEPIVTARDARAALEIAFAAIESAASGKPITLAS